MLELVSSSDEEPRFEDLVPRQLRWIISLGISHVHTTQTVYILSAIMLFSV